MGCQCSQSIKKEEKQNENILLNNIQNGMNIDEKPMTNIIKIRPFSKFESFSNQNTKVTSNSKNNNYELKNQFNNSFNNQQNILSFQLLQQINIIRTNPLSYIDIINKYKDKIIQKNNKFYLNVKKCHNTLITLEKGEIAFNECIKKLYLQPSLEPIELNNKLKLDVNIPLNNENISIDYYTSLEFMKKIIENKLKLLDDNFEIIGFHYDKSLNDPELSAVLQLIDDTGNEYSRRKNILNQKVKYVGISVVNLKDDVYCYYLLFACNK
jgi:hypothetical protein